MRDKNTPLEEVIESFLMHRHDLSEATVANYRLQLRFYCDWLGRELGRSPRTEDVEPGLVNAFLSFRKSSVSGHSAHAAWKALRSLGNFLAERRLHHDAGGSVLRVVRAPKVKDESRRALSDDEMSLLIQHAGDGEMGGRDRAIVWTLLGCGLRRQELSSLRVGDIYLLERRLHVQATTSKSVHPRDVTISIEVRKELDVYIGDHRSGADPDEPLFIDRHGRPLTGTAVRKLFERLKARTGIRGLCAHMLRHTWATNYHRSSSGSRLDLQVEGGWTTGRMVERYCKARPFEERRRAPSVFTAYRAATSGKRPSGKRPPQQERALDGKRIA
jgi:site-specific recombinase XerC